MKTLLVILVLSMTACAQQGSSSLTSAVSPSPTATPVAVVLPTPTPVPAQAVSYTSAQACAAIANWDQKSTLQMATNVVSFCSPFGQMNWNSAGIDFIEGNVIVMDINGAQINSATILLDECTITINSGIMSVSPATAPNNTNPQLGC